MRWPILFALVATAIPSSAIAQTQPVTAVDLGSYAKQADLATANANIASLQSSLATVQALPSGKAPLCSITTIPAGNNVINTAVETQFVSACYIPPGYVQAGTVVREDSRFLFGVSATVPSLRGRVYLATTAAPNLSTCVSANTCVLLLDTGPVTGLAAGAALGAKADVSITFPTVTSAEAEGDLLFRTTAAAAISIIVTSATSTSSTPLTIPWNIATNGGYLLKSAQWGAQDPANYIQLRQNTVR